MATETTSQASVEAAAQAATPEPASPDHTINADGNSEAQATGTFEPLFDTETISEAELMGEETEEAKDKPKAQEKPSETKEAEPSPPIDEKEATEDASDGTGEAGKPPKGFVPIQALHQERGQRQVLSQEVSQLRAELEAFKTAKKAVEATHGAPKDVEEFKVLSEQEFNELLEEDPVEAIKYDRKFRAYEARQAEQAKAKQSDQAMIDQSMGMMAEAVPGLYDQDSDVNQRLSEFAVENGFTDLDGLALVTDPRTRVLPANGGNPKPLGQAAASLVLMLNNLFQEASKPPDKGAQDAQTKLEQRIREQVTQELLSKIKQPAGTEHRSLGDVPGDAGADASALEKVLSETEFSRLSEADQRRLLGG